MLCWSPLAAIGQSKLKSISCAGSAFTGAGTYAGSLELDAAAPAGGQTVTLSSSNAAVSVPASVTVPENATQTAFLLSVAPVSSPQAVTVSGSAGGATHALSIQLYAASPALSIDNSSLSFGNVLLKASATQTVTLSSTGTEPVEVTGLSMAGPGYRFLGVKLPMTLNPGQQETLTVVFTPLSAGAANGSLTVYSTSRTNSRAVIAISGTGVPAVAVAVTPATVSAIAGTSQQFNASVTGSSNTAVTWSVSGAGCTGPSCGTISSSGLYSAPAAIPASATVVITATSAANPGISASASATVVPPQAAGYQLAWEDTFSNLNLCTGIVAGCTWYGTGTPWTATSDGTVTDESGSYANLSWTSGQHNSFTNLTTSSMAGTYFRAWTYGYFEIRMAFNPVAGNWPALWMRPVQTIGDPSANGGELDIFEWQSQTPNEFYGTAHVWSNGADMGNNNSSNAAQAPAGTNFANYNNYGVLWTPTHITWFLNNVPMGTLSTAAPPFSTVFGGSESYFLILGEQAGCNWIYAQDAPCPGQVSPLNMKVQWVHVYQLPPG